MKFSTPLVAFRLKPEATRLEFVSPSSLERLPLGVGSWNLGVDRAVSVNPFDGKKVRESERRQPRRYRERTLESKPLNEPADRGRAGADAGIERREDRPERGASPLG